MARWNAAAVLIGALTGASVAADANDSPRAAFFGFALINTSLEPTKLVEDARRFAPGEARRLRALQVRHHST